MMLDIRSQNFRLLRASGRKNAKVQCPLRELRRIDRGGGGCANQDRVVRTAVVVADEGELLIAVVVVDAGARDLEGNQISAVAEIGRDRCQCVSRDNRSYQ